MQLHAGIIVLALLATGGWYLTNEGAGIWASPDVWIIGAGLCGIALAYVVLQRGAVRWGALIYVLDCAAVALSVPFVPGGHVEIGMLASLIIPAILAALIFSTRQLAALLVSSKYMQNLLIN